jgi:hypothetical protein
MKKNRSLAYTRLHSPSTFSGDCGRLQNTHSPTPIYMMGGRLCVRVPDARGVCAKKKKSKTGEWIRQIPPEYLLPDSIEEIEAGRLTQERLFKEPSELGPIRQRKEKR